MSANHSETTLALPEQPTSRVGSVKDQPSGTVTPPTDPEKGAASPDSASIKQDAPVRTVHGVRWFLVCMAIYLAAFTYGLDTTIAADVQSAVVETFGEVQQLSWLGTGFLLGSVATILPIGALYERFDIKYNFLAGIVLFEIGSAICGAAPTMDALIVGRVIAGIGGSGVYLGALSYFSALTSETERGMYIAATGAFWGIGCVVGPVIGGAFAQSAATWRWGFYINLIIAALCAPIYLTMPGYAPQAGVSRWARVRHVDWVGAALSMGAWATFTVLFSFAGALWAWTAPSTIAVGVVFGALLAAFIAQQGFTIGTSPANRLFPVQLLVERTQLLLALTTGAGITGMLTSIYYLPLWASFVLGDGPIDAAVRLLPFLVISMSVNLAVGILVPRVRYYAALYLAAGVFILAGSIPLYFLTPATPTAHVYGFSVLVALGSGLVIQVGYTLASVHAAHHGHPEDIPHTIAFQNVAQIGGGAVALIIAGQVFQTYAFRNLGAALAGLGLQDAQLREMVAGAQSAAFRLLDAEQAARAVEAITAAMANVWILVITAGAMLVVSSALMRWERLF